MQNMWKKIILCSLWTYEAIESNCVQRTTHKKERSHFYTKNNSYRSDSGNDTNMCFDWLQTKIQCNFDEFTICKNSMI